MSNFTEMEDAIMDCWGVVNDLRSYAQRADGLESRKLLESLATVYDFKMDRMYDLYELCLKDYYELKNAPTPGKIHLTDKLIEDIAQEFADLDGGIFCDKWVPYARAVIKEQENDVPW
jgi:hypothetical protein